MSKKGAGYRLRKELLAINKDRPEFIWATHKETNILLWSFLVAPPDDTVYGGGYYWGRVTFPQDYPFAPPGIQFVTPSGRFRPETMRWQFVVATRQTALTLVAFFGQLCSDGSAYSEGSAAARALVWAQAGSALLVLLVALGAHFRAQPFRYRFQNQLEGGLFASDALLISSCLCYTVRRRSAHDAPVTAR